MTEPRTGLDERCSVEYATAVALLDGRLALPRFADRPLDEDATRLLPRIRRQVDHEFPSIGAAPGKRLARIDVLTRASRRLQQTATRVRGVQDLRDQVPRRRDGSGRGGADTRPRGGHEVVERP